MAFAQAGRDALGLCGRPVLPAAMPEKLLTVPEDAQTVVAALSGLLGEPFSGGRRSAGAASELFLHAFLPQTGCSRKQEDESADKSS